MRVDRGGVRFERTRATYTHRAREDARTVVHRRGCGRTPAQPLAVMEIGGGGGGGGAAGLGIGGDETGRERERERDRWCEINF
ncbi:hypothetical protein [Oryza sativa Japonica Group]|uniref:Uncharacterized protein n=1 Tax=Oryza sativa subsp. japonica TaxID=39947 RepID=Q657W0_ORYSJ|nr:hypothetical protein [Oryza sativa Japonica Group]